MKANVSGWCVYVYEMVSPPPRKNKSHSVIRNSISTAAVNLHTCKLYFAQRTL